MLRCRGKSYLDLLAQRAGACEDAPDAVVAPADHEQVLAVLQVCAEAGVAVVPFGGGTSVVGGLEPLRGRFEALVSLDLGRMDRRPRRRRALADRGAGARPAAAGGRPRSGRSRPHARTSPAELRVGERRRLRRDALLGPGLDRAGPDRRQPRRRPLRDAARRALDPRRAGQRRRAGAAAAGGRVGGRARGDHGGHSARAPAAGGLAVRGLARARLRGRLRGAAGARAGGRGSRRGAAVGRGRDAPHARLRAAPPPSPAARSAIAA